MVSTFIPVLAILLMALLTTVFLVCVVGLALIYARRFVRAVVVECQVDQARAAGPGLQIGRRESPK